MVEGSSEVKLSTIWTDGKAAVGRVREEKRRREKIREEKESLPTSAFPSVHIVESLTSKLPSTMFIHVLSILPRCLQAKIPRNKHGLSIFSRSLSI
jgi:hypothetical protein